MNAIWVSTHLLCEFVGFPDLETGALYASAAKREKAYGKLG
ncbi:hypothetical protein RSK20926_05917 [Roseobacter sp. SK209-2-6]|nr:hypothetical protein RSK20926_05917 [Roseobacter sp. SK209-2-6]